MSGRALVPARVALAVAALVALLPSRPLAAPGGFAAARTIGRTWASHSGWVSFIAVSPDGKTVASDGADPDGRRAGLTYWSFPEGRFLRSVPGYPRAISPDWHLLAVEGRVVDLSSGATVFESEVLASGFRAAVFTPDSQRLAVTREHVVGQPPDEHIVILEARSGVRVRSFGHHHADALAASPDGSMLASGHWDGVTLWRIESGERIARLRGFGRYVTAIGFSRNGRFLAAGSDTGELQIWSVADRRRVHSTKIALGTVSSLAFSPDSRRVAAGTYHDGLLTIVDVRTGRVLRQTKASEFGCGSVAFSEDGRFVIVPSNGGVLRARHYEDGGAIKVYELQ